RGLFLLLLDEDILEGSHGIGFGARRSAVAHRIQKSDVQVLGGFDAHAVDVRVLHPGLLSSLLRRILDHCTLPRARWSTDVETTVWRRRLQPPHERLELLALILPADQLTRIRAAGKELPSRV